MESSAEKKNACKYTVVYYNIILTCAISEDQTKFHTAKTRLWKIWMYIFNLFSKNFCISQDIFSANFKPRLNNNVLIYFI